MLTMPKMGFVHFGAPPVYIWSRSNYYCVIELLPINLMEQAAVCTQAAVCLAKVFTISF